MRFLALFTNIQGINVYEQKRWVKTGGNSRGNLFKTNKKAASDNKKRVTELFV